MGEDSILDYYYDMELDRELVELEYAGNKFRVPAKLNDRYRIVDILASGGNGVIYVAKDELLADKKVLVKSSKYNPSLFNHPNNKRLDEKVNWCRKLLKREAKAFFYAWNREISGVSTLLDEVVDINPDIYGPHQDIDSGEEFFIKKKELVENERYLVLTYVEGEVLSENNQWLKESPLDFCRAFLNNMARTLLEFHKAVHIKKIGVEIEMVYLDLKPKNIIYSTEGSFFLIDLGSFSFVVNTKQDKKVITNLTRTPGYSAPELDWAGSPEEKVTPLVDIYSLGASVYRLLTGENPASVGKNETFNFDFEKIENEYDSEWRKFLEKTLTYNKQDRYQGMAELINAIPKA